MVGRRSCYTRGERPTVGNYCHLLFGSVRFGCIPEVGSRLPIRLSRNLYLMFGSVRLGSVTDPNRKLVVVDVQLLCRSVVVVLLSLFC